MTKSWRKIALYLISSEESRPGIGDYWNHVFSGWNGPIQKELAGNVQDLVSDGLRCLPASGNCPACTLMRSRHSYLKGKNSEKIFCASQYADFIKPLLKVIISLWNDTTIPLLLNLG